MEEKSAAPRSGWSGVRACWRCGSCPLPSLQVALEDHDKDDDPGDQADHHPVEARHGWRAHGIHRHVLKGSSHGPEEDGHGRGHQHDVVAGVGLIRLLLKDQASQEAQGGEDQHPDRGGVEQVAQVGDGVIFGHDVVKPPDCDERCFCDRTTSARTET